MLGSRGQQSRTAGGSALKPGKYCGCARRMSSGCPALLPGLPGCRRLLQSASSCRAQTPAASRGRSAAPGAPPQRWCDVHPTVASAVAPARPSAQQAAVASWCVPLSAICCPLLCPVVQLLPDVSRQGGAAHLRQRRLLCGRQQVCAGEWAPQRQHSPASTPRAAAGRRCGWPPCPPMRCPCLAFLWLLDLPGEPARRTPLTAACWASPAASSLRHRVSLARPLPPRLLPLPLLCTLCCGLPPPGSLHNHHSPCTPTAIPVTWRSHQLVVP